MDSVELRNIALPQKIQTKIEELQAEKQNVMIAEQQKRGQRERLREKLRWQEERLKRRELGVKDMLVRIRDRRLEAQG